MLGRLEPESLTLERVGGQGDFPPSWQDLGPIQSQALSMKLADREEQATEWVLVAPQRADNGGRHPGGFERLVQSQGEHWMGTHFDEESIPIRNQGLHGLGEA